MCLRTERPVKQTNKRQTQMVFFFFFFFAVLVGNNTIIGPAFLERSIDSQVYLDLSNDHTDCSRSPQVISTTAEWGFSQSMVYICRMVLLLTVPYLSAIACKSCLAIVWLEYDIRLIGQPEVQISLHWTSICGVQSRREFTDKALLQVFDNCGIASLMPSTRSDAPER